MEFPSLGFLPVKQFSGLYKVIKCEHSFSQGEFTQQLRLMRVKQQDTDSTNAPVSGAGGALQNVDPERQITPTPEAAQGGSEGSSQNGTGGTATAQPTGNTGGTGATASGDQGDGLRG